MLLNYQYRAYPDTNQKLKLNEWLRICQYWYNLQLGERFTWWQDNNLQLKSFPWWKELFPPLFDTKPGYYEQKAQLPIIKEDLRKVWHSGELLDFKSVPSQTLQDVSKRVDLAFSRFLKGDIEGKKSGKPRFKNAASFSTIKIEGQAVTIERVEKDWLFLSVSKLAGWIKVRLHRPLPDGFTLKNILVTRKVDGWYFTIALDDPTVPVFNPNDIIPTWENSFQVI